jgi:hypothetical protein
MTPKQAKKILKKQTANVYASIYDERFQKTARQAFIDGMVFWDMVKAGVVTEDMINADFFAVMRESNG